MEESLSINIRTGKSNRSAYVPPPVTPTEVRRQKDIRVTAIRADCQAEVFAGFTSSALGAAHTYPAKNLDQQNLVASVVASLMPGTPPGWTTPFWCADATGAWAFVPHTAKQIQQVGQDAKAAVLASLAKSQALAAQVEAAADVKATLAVIR